MRILFKKASFVIVSVCLFVFQCNRNPLNANNQNPFDVIVVGSKDDYICYWINETKYNIIEINSPFTTAYEITALDNNIYIAGSKMYEPTQSRIACYWANGGDGYDLSRPPDWAEATSIHAKGDTIFTAGTLWEDVKSDAVACYWINNKRFILSDETSSTSDITVFEDDIYVSGNIRKDSVLQGCYWKNGNKVDLNNNCDGSQTLSISIYNGDVYVTGWAMNYDGTTTLSSTCYWKNIERVDLEPSMPYVVSKANSILVIEDDVYVVGYTRDSYNDPQNSCYWRNGKLVVLSDQESEAKSIFLIDNDIYIAGIVKDDITKKSYACYWKNGELTKLVEGIISDIILSKEML